MIDVLATLLAIAAMAAGDAPELSAPAGACARSDAPAAPPAPRYPSPPTSAEIHGCAWKSAPEILAMGAVQWVDARRPHERSVLGIAGSWSLGDVGELATADSPTLVLLGNGVDRRELDTACASLKASGHAKVVGLRGGVRAAVVAGVSLWGEPDEARLTEITPAQAQHAVRSGSAALLIIDRHPDAEALDDLLGEATRVAAPDAAFQAMDHLASNQVVIVAASAVDRNALDGMLQSADGLPTVFWVAGGLAALSAHVHEFRAIAQAAHTPLTQPCFAQPKE